MQPLPLRALPRAASDRETLPGAPEDDIRPNAELTVRRGRPNGAGFGTDLVRRVPGKVWFTAAGGVVLYSDQVNAMPVDQLAHVLQGTPFVRLTDQTAQSVASHLKAFSSSTVGSYVIIGLSGGLVTVGAAFVAPKASLKWRVVQFVAGTLVCVGLLWLAYHYGVAERKPATP